MDIPAVGDYWLAIGSSPVRGSAGGYRLTVGIDATEVLTGNIESSGAPFVFPGNEIGGGAGPRYYGSQR